MIRIQCALSPEITTQRVLRKLAPAAKEMTAVNSKDVMSKLSGTTCPVAAL